MLCSIGHGSFTAVYSVRTRHPVYVYVFQVETPLTPTEGEKGGKNEQETQNTRENL